MRYFNSIQSGKRFKYGDRVRYISRDLLGKFLRYTQDIEEKDIGTVKYGGFGIYCDPSHRLVRVDFNQAGLRCVIPKNLEKI